VAEARQPVQGRAPAATVAVVGGGIAGLSAALAATDALPGASVIVLEADGRVGGKLRSADIGGRAVDLGPDAFLARRPEALSLCDELGLSGDLVAPGSRTAYVWARGRLRPLPAGLALGIPTRLGPLARSGILSPLGLGRAAWDLVGWDLGGRPPARHGTEGHAGEPTDRGHPRVADRGAGARGVADRAVADITASRLGRQVTARLVDPLIGGIHAGDTARMSAAAVFPPLLEAGAHRGSLMRALRGAADAAASASTAAAASAGGGDGSSAGGGGDGRPPVFLTVDGGLARLVDRLAETLRSRGAELRTGFAVRRMERTPSGGDGGPHPGAGRWALVGDDATVYADAVVLATPADAAGRLLGPLDPATAGLLASVDYADVTLVTLRMAEGDVGAPLDGTGFLVPSEGGGLVTACTWLTSKWPRLRRPGDVLLRASTGRMGDRRPVGLSDGELVARVLDELGPILRMTATPLDAVVTRWPGAFPQYGVGHLDRVAALEAGVARLPCLALAGAALRGVGIPACIGSGRQAAAAVLASLAGTETASR